MRRRVCLIFAVLHTFYAKFSDSDKKENLIKLKKIIEEEYNKEISQKHDQIEKIELQICKVRKLLHLLRYVLIMSYYKKQELEYSDTEPSTSDLIVPPDKQSRIHPAIKKLLGKNAQNVDQLYQNNKRKSHARDKFNDKVIPKQEISILHQAKKIKLDPEIIKKTTIKAEITPELIRNRKKTKYIIIVGNISKFLTTEEDILTHKWMVYVRGPKDKPDISSFVQKVVFYLHPSYKPYDVVEIR